MSEDDAARIALLLDEARRAREGRDQWRQVGPTLRELRDRGVSYRTIREATGISPATVGSIVATTSRIGGNTPSTETS